MSSTTQRRSRHSTDALPEFHDVAPQATVSEGLAQDPYVAARAGVKPMTLRTKGVDSTKASPHLTDIIMILCYRRDEIIQAILRERGLQRRLRRRLRYPHDACALRSDGSEQVRENRLRSHWLRLRRRGTGGQQVLWKKDLRDNDPRCSLGPDETLPRRPEALPRGGIYLHSRYTNPGSVVACLLYLPIFRLPIPFGFLTSYFLPSFSSWLNSCLIFFRS